MSKKAKPKDKSKKHNHNSHGKEEVVAVEESRREADGCARRAREA